MNINREVGRILGIFLVGMLLLSMVMVVSVKAVPVAKLCVDIPCWVGWYDHEFVANVNITDVEDLYSFGFKLGWETEYIDFIGVEISPPAEWGTDYVIVKNETIENYNATHGRYWLNVSALAPAPSFNGSMILTKLTFKVTYGYLCPPCEIWCCLDLYDTELWDSEGLLISHGVYDGSLVILCMCPCIPEMIVKPSYYEATSFGENFTINIFFNLLNSYFDFGHWKAKLGYNTTLLDVITVEEGSFIGRFRKSDKRYFTANIHEEEGYVNMTGGILGPCATPYGAGTLAKVTFNVTYVTVSPTIATCVLDLYDTNFTDSEGQPTLQPDVTDGSYKAPCVPPPSCTLTIYSSPSGVPFTVDSVSRTAPWSGTYTEGASVSLVMPETHDGYEWSHWLEDGDTNRFKTVTMDTNITLTAVYERIRPVGGKATPISNAIIKPQLQIPWIWLLTITFPLALTVAYVKKRKRHTEINS